MTVHFKPTSIALIYGALAGALAALTLFAMTKAQHWLWSATWANSALGIFIIISCGGVILAALHHRYRQQPISEGLDEQLHTSQSQDRRTLTFLALSAIVAMGFGGAVGPEAGLLAVIGQLSAMLSTRLDASYQTKQLILDAGTSATLAGLYAAPPAVVMLSDENTPTPKIIKFLAGFSGMMGFVGVHKLLTDQPFMRLAMPEHIANISDAWWALPAVILAIPFGLGFLYLHHQLPKWLSSLKPTWQIIIGSTLFATLAAMVPLVRFSGHHDIEHFLANASHEPNLGISWLLLLASTKLVAIALCLTSGWRGGEFFPLVFSGFVLGTIIHLLLPNIAISVAIMGATSTLLALVMGKPLVVVLVLLLLIGIYAPSAVFAGVLTGYGVRRLGDNVMLSATSLDLSPR